MRQSASVLLALMMGTSPALAQEVIDLGTITISASDVPTETRRTGVSVEILTQEALETAPETKLSDVLSTLPGVNTNSNGGLGAATDLSIRGLPSRYVGVRLNGIDITDPSLVQTQLDWGAFTPAGLGRAEVLKGSQSAIYGSETIGGVVVLETVRPTEDGTTVTISGEFGSYDTQRGDLVIATKAGRGDLVFTLSHVKTDGFSAADEDDGNTEEDDFEGTFATLSAGYDVSDALRLGVDLIWQKSNFNIDAFGGPGGDADRPNDTDRRGGRIYAEFSTGTVEHELALSRFVVKRRDRLTPFGSPYFRGERTELRYVGVADLGSTTLSFGSEYSEEKAEFGSDDADFDIFSVFGEAQYAVSADLDVSGALRYDHHSEFGSETTGRVALAWRPSAQTVVRASIATGFRAPSLNELFGPFNAGPVDLDPEKSRSADFGVEHAYSNGARVQATVFYTEIDDLISYPVDRYEQVPGTSVTKGIELAARLPLTDSWALFGNYTYADAEQASGDRIPRVPRHDLLLGVEADFTNGWSGQLVLNRITDRYDGFPLGPVDDYTLVNASVRYALTSNAEVYMRIENLFDEDYQTAAGYGTSDRAFYLGLRATY